MNENWDVIIVGGGAAGLSAALTLSRQRRRVLVVDAGAPRNATAAHLHNYLGREGATPFELLAIGRAEAEQYGATIISATVTDAKVTGAEVVVTSTAGEHRGRQLLLATGLRDELPDIPGVAERWGRDVLHCVFCHGWEVRDQAIGVIATTPMAAHAAQLFRQQSADVIIFRHQVEAFEPQVERELAARGVGFVDVPVAGLEVTDDVLTGVRLSDGTVVPRAAVVVASRALARTEGLEGLGLVTEEANGMGTVLPTDAMGKTSVDRVWAAGNLASMPTQLITASAEGLRVASMIHMTLVTEEIAAAVAAAA